MLTKSGSSAMSFLRGRLKLRHLRLLLAIENAHTITGAAALLGVTQVAASKTLAEIEAGLGSKLFERRRSGLVPTESCLQMLETGRRIIGEIECLGEEFVMVNGGLKGRVRIGLQTQSAQPFLTRAIVEFKAAYPLITVEITLGTTQEFAADLARGHLHFVIGPRAMLELQPGLESAPIPAEQAVVVAGPECPYVEGTVSWAQIAEGGWLLPPPGKPLRNLFDRILAREGLPLPTKLIEMPPTFLAEAILRCSGFHALAPGSVGQQWARRGDIRLVNIDVPLISDPMRLMWSQHGPMTPAGRMFLTFVRGEITSEMQEEVLMPV